MELEATIRVATFVADLVQFYVMCICDDRISRLDYAYMTNE